MRLTLVGGGGFRVPLVYRALCEDQGPGRVGDVVLYDTDAARVGRVVDVLAELARGRRQAPRVHVVPELAEAVRGADFIFSAIRVGGLAGRTWDERAALQHGLLGQETTGAGGLCYGLRTVPVALALAAVVRREAPDAWVINFTNPAGMVTEAMTTVLGERVIGICDSPASMFARVAGALGVPVTAATFDYAGLNHLGWLQRVLVEGGDVLPRLLADRRALESFEEGRLFTPGWLQLLGMIPNEYLYYYYFTRDAVDSIVRAPQTRGELLLAQQAEFYSDRSDVYARWDSARRERNATYMAETRPASDTGEQPAPAGGGTDDGGFAGGYDKVALALMRAIAHDEPTSVVLNVPNRGALPGLDDDAVVEIGCAVAESGPAALPVTPLPLHALGLVQSVKAAERMVVEAAAAGSRALAVKALALHPLVDSFTVAGQIIDTQLEHVPELRTVLTRP